MTEKIKTYEEEMDKIKTLFDETSSKLVGQALVS